MAVPNLSDVKGLAAAPDFTWGTVQNSGKGLAPTLLNQRGSTPFVGNPSGIWQANNSELVTILNDVIVDLQGNPTADYNHNLNPQQTKFLDGVKSVNWSRNPGAAGAGVVKARGIGPDNVLRDPWGNQLVLLDTTKGLLATDEDGNVIGNK